jgi:hypothetical protein
VLVYGERRRRVDPRAALADVLGVLALGRPAASSEALIALGVLAQGLADAEFAVLGYDHDTPLQAAAMAALISLARPLVAGAARPVDRRPLMALAAQPMPEAVIVKAPEGYAYYAAYPEAYAKAAARLQRADTVIGLRSIGTSLAAVAAAALDAPAPITLRPTGHPFARELRLSPRLEARLAAPGRVVLVDEGPGLSGSSFGAVADHLERAGAAPDMIAFLPSHGGDLGPMANEAHRRRWATARRPVVSFDDLALQPSDPGLAKWVEDLTGPPVAPLIDLSGGAWRAPVFGPDPSVWPPVYAGQERRKVLLRSASGLWLLKFAGLDQAAHAKLERALALGRAGLAPPPAGLRRGFIVQPWIAGRPLGAPIDRRGLLAALVRYLAFRARTFPASVEDGAGEGDLRVMVEANAGEALGPAAARTILDRLPRGLNLRPIRTDGRLHRWEWLVAADGRLLKTDSLDHDDAHDLIGCQDLAWDVAGAEAELGLSADESDALVRRLGAAGCRVAPDALRFMRAAYPAFQLGLWTHALQAADRAERGPIAALVEGYLRRLSA